MKINEIKKLIKERAGDTITEERQRTITASLQTALAYNPGLNHLSLVQILDKLLNNKPDTVQSYNKLEEKCPRCKAAMEPVMLHNDRNAAYCPPCRIAMPLIIKD